MQGWNQQGTSVPALAAIYDANAPKKPLAFPDGALPESSLGSALVVLARSRTLTLETDPGLASFSRPSLGPLGLERVTSGFGLRLHPILGGLRQHNGVDLAASIGTPIRATGDGVVVRAGWSGGYGLLVAINHGDRTETRYGHMSRLAVEPGEHVRKDSIIGYVGSTGRSTGPHLHYEVLVAGKPVNPLPYMR